MLSDPQEKAWYDSHRDAILRDDDDVSGGHFEHNVRLTAAEDLVRMFSRFKGKMDFSDSNTGFYSILRNTFATLAKEEEMAREWEDLNTIIYPSFGYANSDCDTVVKPFYAAWNGFATRKSYSWKDVYRYPDAADRRVRRLMEKENKRFRDEGVREFNDAVRSLLAFVRKRDPRFKPNTQSEAERQRILRDAVAAQAARSRAANQANLAPQGPIPDWMMNREDFEDDDSDEQEDERAEQVECVVCKKTFKSEKQYEAHERSKKHTKAVQQLRRQMERENIALDLEDYSSERVQTVDATTLDPFDVHEETFATRITDGPSEDWPPGAQSNNDCNANDWEDPNKRRNAHVLSRADSTIEIPKRDLSANSSDDEYATREKVESRLVGQDKSQGTFSEDASAQFDIDDLSQEFAAGSLGGETDSSTQPRLGRAKVKRAKKAAQSVIEAPSSDKEFRCAACQAGFPSKTRLFHHIKDLGHAQPVLKATNGRKGKRR